MEIRAVAVAVERIVAMVTQMETVVEDRIVVVQNMFIHVAVRLQNIIVAV